jgi:hypothetical protein
MIKNLFTKRDHRSFPGMTKEQAMQAASWFWRSRQFGVNFTSPYSVHSEQFFSKLGLRQSVDVFAVDEGSSVGVDMSFSAELTDTGGVVGLVGAVIWWPIAVAGGAVSYIEYENDAQRLMGEFWNYVQSFPRNPQPPAGPTPLPTWAQGAPQPSGPQPAVTPLARVCPSCSASIDPDSVFCKRCGARL